MHRAAAAAVCLAALLAGFIIGRATGPSSTPVTVTATVPHVVLIKGEHVGSARDARGSGRLDLVRVASKRRGAVIETTITAARPWQDTVLRKHHAGMTILYDVNGDGATDRRDVVFLFHGTLVSWVSSLNQGVQAADLHRSSTRSLTVDRDASIFFNASGQSSLMQTSVIGVAVVATWPGGSDRVPDRGWIEVPPPSS